MIRAKSVSGKHAPAKPNSHSAVPSGNSNSEGTSVDWPPLFVGSAKGVYKHQVLAESQSRGFERLLEIALLDRCGGKADTWVGNEQLADDTRVHEKSIPRLLKRLESSGKWKAFDDSRVDARRRIIDLSHPHAEAVVEALRQSPHVKFERSRSNPEAIARTKKSAGLPFSDNSHGRVTVHYPPEGNRLLPKPLTVPVQPLKNGNSRVRGEPALEDGGTGGEKNLSNGNGNGKPLATDNHPPVVGSLPAIARPDRCKCSVPLEVLGDGAGVRCPACKATKLSQVVPVPAAAAPQDLAASPLEFLERLRPGAASSVCDQAAAVLQSAFGPTDSRDSSRAYRKVVNKVQRGYLAPEVIVYAFQQAMDPSAVNPGSVFVFNVEHRTMPPKVSKSPAGSSRKEATRSARDRGDGASIAMIANGIRWCSSCRKRSAGGSRLERTCSESGHACNIATPAWIGIKPGMRTAVNPRRSRRIAGSSVCPARS